MTVVGRDKYGEDMLPCYRYRYSACPRCKATTEDDAGSICQPVQTPSGEYECPGDTGCLNPFGIKWTSDGRACELVNSDAIMEAKAIDEWVRKQIQSQETKRG